MAEDDARRRKQLAKEYAVAFDTLRRILFTADPIGISFETNTDEYDPEVGTILPRLHDCRSVEDVRNVIYEEFARWFNDDDNVGTPASYQAIAERVWLDVMPHIRR